MKKSFMTRALAMGLSLAMAFSLSAATNVSVASAAATPAMASKQFAVRVGGAAKSYKASAATQKSFKITKATVGNTDKATVKVNSSKKSIKVTPGTVTGTTVVKVTFKNIKTAKTTAKKYRCVVKAAIEPEKPVEPEVVKATKITEAKAATAKTVSVTFDGVVDTSTATAIKLERGTTAITVTPKYADDAKSVTLTSDTSLAAGTYTVTVGSLAPVSFNVVKQTPTSLKIANTTIANQKNARVYFQVLDQYGEAMENYTDKKLTVRAYNATKGHSIDQGASTKKDYFVLDCSTETVSGTNYLNAIGDKISIVAYLTDNAAVSCTTELEIVRVYTTELTFGDVKLGNDKRVTVNKTYEIDYTAKDNEGNAVTFDEQSKNAVVSGVALATATTVSVNNYNFISSNISAVDMRNVFVDSNGRLQFVAGKTAGTAVITAINTITGESSSITIVVSNTAKLSSLEIADASVACNAKGDSDYAKATKFKAAVTAYDQFGEVIDPKNVKNVRLDAEPGTYFNSLSITPPGYIKPIKITDDGKYVEYQVLKSISGLKNQSVRFDFVSKEMGESGYIRSAATVSVDDEIEASALEIVKKPDATVSETKKVNVQFAVKDQYQNKMTLVTSSAIKSAIGDSWAYKYGDGATPNVDNSYVVTFESTNGVVSQAALAYGDDDKVYKMEFQAPAISDLSEDGTFTLKLMDGPKVIASETFNLTVVDSITKYSTRITNGYKFKAGETIKVEVDAYSGSNFNVNYNETRDVKVEADNGKVYSKTIKFVNGTASFELTAGTKTVSGEYEVKVTDKNPCANNSTTAATATTEAAKYVVVGNAAGKIGVESTNGHLVLLDSQGNRTTAGARNTYATFKLMDATTKTDITWDVSINGWSLRNDATLPIHITGSNEVDDINGDGGAYSLISGLSVTNIPATCSEHNLVLTITVDGLTLEKSIAAQTIAPGSTGSESFTDAGAIADAATEAARLNAVSVFNDLLATTTGTVSSSAMNVTISVPAASCSAIATSAGVVTVSKGAASSTITPATASGISLATNRIAITLDSAAASAYKGGDTIYVDYDVTVTGIATVNSVTKTKDVTKHVTLTYTFSAGSNDDNWSLTVNVR